MIILIMALGLAVLPFTPESSTVDDQIIFWAVFLGFPLSGALPLWRPTEDVIARLIFRYRRPTPQEQQRLDALWGAVAQRAGIDPGTYTLGVQDTDEVNAFAGSGHTVGVTRFALTQLAPQHLEAVLAHELGHHLGGHPRARIMVYWYSLPARAVLRIGWLVTRLVLRIFAVVLPAVWIFSPRNTGPTAIVGCMVVVFPLFCLLPFYIWLSPLLLAPPIEAWFSRRSELHADRVAVELGYGPALMDLFQFWQARGADDEYAQASAFARMMTTHPPFYTRVQAMQRHLQQGRS